MTKTKLEHIIESKTVNVYALDMDTLLFEYKPNTLIELNDLKFAYDKYSALTKHKLHKVIIDFPQFTSLTAEAREYAVASQLPAIAEAIVFKSLAQRITARFYYMFNAKKHPVKVFNDRKNAIAWLERI
ncbi:DUF7793 family protein [Crocinitomix catalasitica]|uniref:DUF7793 family protein n=1 Tax=Crocinitomix catalasitica TaxID=184607 RepID=UPI000489561D|nr:hypothetical protein [Crocinitomix catalasitica]